MALGLRIDEALKRLGELLCFFSRIEPEGFLSRRHSVCWVRFISFFGVSKTEPSFCLAHGKFFYEKSDLFYSGFKLATLNFSVKISGS
ncbi:hypothetical protein [Geopsychrobacter electrodiphilus]|uniref:hypothetical protein n=1 Tax=Geopsychrobacter electrodiphilus TaxID=225196 RepID=UPI000360FE09|nr:hypothetical protein [Geopsychrobacter electrodiphilus]